MIHKPYSKEQLCSLPSCLPTSYFWNWPMKQYFVDYEFHTHSQPSPIFPSHATLVLSGRELQNLNGIHNEMLGYFRAKRSNLEKLNNWVIHSLKI